MKQILFTFVITFFSLFVFEATAEEKYVEELVEAAAKGDLKEVRSLIAAGADVNARDPKEGLTPLISAVRYGQKAIVETLIKSGADVNGKDKQNQSTPLLWAVSTGEEDPAGKSARTEIVKILIRSGADLQAKNANGDTVFTIAKQAGDEDVIDMLKKAEADENSNQATSGEGWIEGQVTIGPLRPGPVHINDPEPDASKLYSSHKIVILSGDNKVKEVSVDAKGHYKVSLPAGKYRVDFQPHDIGMRPYEPQTVIVQTDKTTMHNLDIDTGMR